MVAAATTSLPERAEAGRNYDYRYVWIRDQCYAGQAVAAAGAHPLLDDAVSFVTARLLEHGPSSPRLHGHRGPVPDQRKLDLRVTRAATICSATGSTNNSSWTPSANPCCCSPPLPGTTVWTPIRDGRRWPRRDRCPLAGTGCRHLGDRQPGLDAQPADLRRGTAGHRGPPTAGPPSEWLTLADRIVAHTAAHATHPTGRGNGPPPTRTWMRRCCFRHCAVRPADDPRTVATLDRYLAELTVDGYAYRFRHDPGHCRRPKDRSPCAVSSRRWRCTNSTGTSMPRGGTNGPGRPPDRRSCTPRSSTPSNTSCAATSRRPSSTPSTWKQRRRSPPRSDRGNPESCQDGG